jgi:oxygen-independent coproporphyrinogen-3 oxidase
MAGLYIHFPYCAKKCAYCDFTSFACESSDTSLFENMVHYISQEITIHSEMKELTEPIESIYFGGGTPSLLHPRQVEAILTHIHKQFSVSTHPEITLEVNPGLGCAGSVDFAGHAGSAVFAGYSDGHTLRSFREAGINRLSIGVQSFNDEELKLLGRMHTASEAEAVIKDAIRSGFENINIDLIFGLPFQTIENWQKNVMKAFRFSPAHLSTYSLTWQNGTPLGKRIKSGILPVPSIEIVAEMMLWTETALERQGYEHYEISNYALTGYRCRHNEKYWLGAPYVGVGPSAHSFVNGRRFWNHRDVASYISDLCQFRLPVLGEEFLSEEQSTLESIAVGIRRKEGIDLDLIRNKNLLKSLKQSGLACEENGMLSLTSQGKLLADEIVLQLVS